MDALGLAVFLATQEERNLTFYRRLGFAVTGRSERDDQGRPYPLLHLAFGNPVPAGEA